MTIVKLLLSKQAVMTIALRMLLQSKGRGQAVEARRT